MYVSKIRTVMEKEGIIFSFSGHISQELTSFMIETAKIELDKSGENIKMTRNMFLIAVEQLQNIMTYSKEKNIIEEDKHISPGVLVIGFDEKKKKYYVNSSNEINDVDKIKIADRIEFINSMNKDELRRFLREKLRSEEDIHARGVGVGLIEMAKRSSEKLRYNFEQINDKLYYQILTYV